MNFTHANDALVEALPAITEAFTANGLKPKAVIVNVVYEKDDHDWAVGSAVPNVEIGVKKMLAASLNESRSEVLEPA